MQMQTSTAVIGFEHRVQARVLERRFDWQFNRSFRPELAPLLAPGGCQLARDDVGTIASLLDALRRLFTATNRLRVQASLGVREQVSIPERHLAALEIEIVALEQHFRAAGMDVLKTAALASDQVANLIATVVLLAKHRYRVRNWAAEVGSVWLKLRTIAMALLPIMPDFAERLSVALAEQAPSWPRLEGIQGVQLAALPCGLTDAAS